MGKIRATCLAVASRQWVGTKAYVVIGEHPAITFPTRLVSTRVAATFTDISQRLCVFRQMNQMPVDKRLKVNPLTGCFLLTLELVS